MSVVLPLKPRSLWSCPRFDVVLLCASLALSAAPAGAQAVTVERDIVYLPSGKAGDAYTRDLCKLDLHLPAPAPGGFPLLVWFHGGALNSGSRTDYQKMAERFAKAGVAVANVDYRLSPQVNYPAYLQDAALAVAWAVREGSGKGARPGAIFVGGHSAGGYLAALLAMNPQFLREAGVPDGSVAGCVPVSGQLITHSTVRAERGLSRLNILSDEAAPLFHVRKDVAPMLLLFADGDMAARGEETRLFVATMTDIAKNTTTSCLKIDGRSHNSIAGRLLTEGDPGGVAVLDFIRKWTPPASTPAAR